MGTIVRCCLILIGITLWLMFATTSVDGSLSSGTGRRRIITINHFFMDEDVGKTPYSECDDHTVGRVTNVEVEGCDTEPCELHTHTNATVKITFVSNVNASSVKAVVHGIIGDIPIPFHIPHENACDATCGLNCPLKAGESYNYSTTIPVLAYPHVSVKVKWELIIENSQVLVCVLIPAKIV